MTNIPSWCLFAPCGFMFILWLVLLLNTVKGKPVRRVLNDDGEWVEEKEEDL